MAELTEQLFEIRGETTILNRDLQAKREQISAYNDRIAILQGALAQSKSRFDALQTTRNANSIVAEQLAIARQELSEEEERLLGRDAERQNQLIGGIPVDSEYIIFIIDTSGSMFSYAWQRMLREMEATLTSTRMSKASRCLMTWGITCLAVMLDTIPTRLPEGNRYCAISPIGTFQFITRRRHHPGCAVVLRPRQENFDLCIR